MCDCFICFIDSANYSQHFDVIYTEYRKLLNYNIKWYQHEYMLSDKNYL